MTPRAYYNEWDRFAAAWLRELIRDGLIMDGDVDERSICDVSATDLVGYTRVHLFSGIAGWDYALRLAGWPAGRPVWTGSCPCQPFSCAGSGKGASDSRHLWPEMFRLVRECRPDTVFGEQVAGAVGFGWLDGVSADLEGEGYACGAVVLGAHSVGAPHIRQRLYWMADGNSNGRDKAGISRGMGGEERLEKGGEPESRCGAIWARDGGSTDRLADAANAHGRTGECGTEAGVGTDGERGRGPSERGDGCGLGNADSAGPQGREQRDGHTGEREPWTPSVPILCRDGFYRRVPIEREFFPLVAGVSPGRVGILRGAGNAIVPQVAAEFVGAYLDISGGEA